MGCRKMSSHKSNSKKVWEEETEIAGDDSDVNKECYTHTFYFEEICWVVCDKKPIQPCSIMK